MSKIPEEFRKELEDLKNRPIDFSDIPEQSAEFWAGAEVGKFYRPIKQQLTIRVDTDIVRWLKADGSGYQTKLNAILRKAMLDSAHKPR